MPKQDNMSDTVNIGPEFDIFKDNDIFIPDEYNKDLEKSGEEITGNTDNYNRNGPAMLNYGVGFDSLNNSENEDFL